MNLFSCVLFVYTCFYFVTAGQAVFYRLCFGQVFLKIPATSFLVIRKLADPLLELKLKIVYFGGLITGVALCVMSITQQSMYQIASMSSMLFFVTDLVFAKKYSMPLNEKIRLATLNDHATAVSLQKAWIRWILIRGNLALIGFAVILLAVVIS
ncbi:MAG: hypothetical protein ABW174_02085 [Flavitalea sp.]